MDQALTSGAAEDIDYSFSKLFVNDLSAMHIFYSKVFGLVETFRHDDIMLGRPISEIGYKPSRDGGPALTLITYLDSDEPIVGEAVQGFVTRDIEAVVERALEAGGVVPEPIRRIEAFALSVVFLLDPEGHVNEVVQLDS